MVSGLHQLTLAWTFEATSAQLVGTANAFSVTPFGHGEERISQ
jgi:hypothetical protein